MNVGTKMLLAGSLVMAGAVVYMLLGIRRRVHRSEDERHER